MNFGKWIVVAFVAFAIFIGTLVTVCVRQDISLVSKEYYKEELAYQGQIQRIQNTRELKEKPIMEKIDAKTLELRFDLKSNVQKGKLLFFCPSNPHMDKSFDLDLSKANVQLVNIASLQKGMYRAKLFWTVEGKEFFVEQVIYI
jgi:hypothetical protein